jgi:hypothetical protein
MRYHRKAPRLKGCRIHKKHYWDIFEAIKNYHYWMFTDSDVSRVEILPPTLDNLNLMKESHLWWVVKGFKNPLEFKVLDNLRVEQGVNSMMYASRSVGNELIFRAINAMLNEEPLPSKTEIDQYVEANKFIPVMDAKSEKRIKEREHYKRLYEKYSILLHRRIFHLIKQGRVGLIEQ